MTIGEPAPAAGQLAQSIEEYLADHPAAAVLEDGRVLFDMRTARYAVSEQHGRCLLQLWSEERNLVRTVVEFKERAHCLRLTTRRMGADGSRSGQKKLPTPSGAGTDAAVPGREGGGAALGDGFGT